MHGYLCMHACEMHQLARIHGAYAQVAAFFLSYILIVMIVVVNIVLAVLLDEFLKAADKEKYETFMERHITDGSASHFQGPLDPFLEYISQFYNWDELLARILEAFRLFDTDNDGEIDFDDVSEGLRRLALQPKVRRDRVALGLAVWNACTHRPSAALARCRAAARADAACWPAVRGYALPLVSSWWLGTGAHFAGGLARHDKQRGADNGAGHPVGRAVCAGDAKPGHALCATRGVKGAGARGGRRRWHHE